MCYNTTMDYMTFFVCNTLEGAQSKELGLRMSGYSTVIKEKQIRFSQENIKEWEVQAKPISNRVERDLWEKQTKKRKRSVR